MKPASMIKWQGVAFVILMSPGNFMRSHLFTLAALVIATLATPAQQPGPWPQFRGPGGMGISPDKGFPTTWSKTENIIYKAALPGAGASSPIIVGESIYLACYTGYNEPGKRGSPESLKRFAVCLNRADGKVVWKTEVESKLPEQDRIRDDHGYATSTPIADGERLYFFFGKSGVVAFDYQGKQLWQADVGARLSDWGSAASPILHGDLVIINASVESDALVGLDRKTGKETWRARGIRESWNTPILVNVNGKTELVVAVAGKILGFDPDTGKQLWSCATDIGWYMVPCLVASEGVIYCVGGRTGGGLAVRAGGRGDVTRSHRLWTMRKGSNVTSPIHHQGHLYWMHEGAGVAYCAEAESGKLVYEKRIPRLDNVYASAVLGDGKLYYVTRDGGTVVLAATPEFKLLATNTLRERGDRDDRSVFNASPALAGGRIYIRSDNFLYCIGTR